MHKHLFIVLLSLIVAGMALTACQPAPPAPAEEATPTEGPTPTPKPTVEPAVVEELALTGVTSNDEWTPYIQEFDGVEMALVPAGCFMMGSEGGDSSERPVHEVCFEEPFWIDVYEVTNAQYGSLGCEESSSDDDQPRNCVSWADAAAHCESRGARLPTEAEWEYAARGPDGLTYLWGDEFNCRLGNFDDETRYDLYTIEGGKGCDGFVVTAPVGSFPDGASWVGALDMSGNVWEWVADWYDDDYYDCSPRDNPGGPDNGEYRVLRGGSWGHDGSNLLRAANRDWDNPSNEDIFNGFRCARSY
jgi:formylglycine-generating enzyme required for sulfatase activity